MCTLALFLDVFQGYPLMVAANRDEHYDRPTAAPAAVRTEPGIVAGRDLRAGGTWLGVNRHGLMAAILNRRQSSATSAPARTRSRGLLCLDMLERRSLSDARSFLQRHGERYDPFTLVVADASAALAAFNDSRAEIVQLPLAAGLHTFSSTAVADTASRKGDRAREAFCRWSAVKRPDAGNPQWITSLKEILSDHGTDENNDPRDAICVHGEASGTVSSSIVLYSEQLRRFRTYYCPGAPCQRRFDDPVELAVSCS